MNITEINYAKVSILDCPYSVDKQFDYAIPEPLKQIVKPGMLVLVPFGASNKRMIALVHSLHDKTSAKRIKLILEVINPETMLSDEALRLCEFVSERCFCTVGTAYKTVMPSYASAMAELIYEVVEKDGYEKLVNDKTKAVLAFMSEGSTVTDAMLEAEFGDEAKTAVGALVKLGIIRKVPIKNTKSGDKFENYISLAEGFSISDTELTPKQLLLAEYLTEYGELTRSDILTKLPVTSSVINTMKRHGYIKSEKREVMRNPFSLLYEETKTPSEVSLSKAQQNAYDSLEKLFLEEKAKAALLFGITGSGKTMVMKKLIDKVIESGKQVIMLLPEIALTPQAIKIFVSFYKERVAVFHSALSIGERHDAWKAVSRGDVDLVIGTRSAIFAPTKRLGLIIIDEEQEDSYKSDIAPKYHARDIARFRCGYNNAMLLLASATPSVESYYKAEKGDYTLIKLTERYGNARLPDTMIADMRYNGYGASDILSKQLIAELAARKERNEKSVLFLNRRGFHVFMSCRACGETVMCPNCSVSLTLHKKHYRNGGVSEKLMCHYCGYTVAPPTKCPTCQKENLKYFGLGTQKVEEELENALPDMSYIRMDADTTVGKMSHKKIIDSFTDGKDILVGTQMVTKGHDFRDVTLVGVLSADMSLHSDDYRANERTFSLITQCAGRAGRANKKGLAIIQTYSPKNAVINYAANQDYEGFYKNEIALRKEMLFPPFCDFLLVNLYSASEHDLMLGASAFKKLIEELQKEKYSDVRFILFGPFEAGIYKLNNSYRMKLILKCKNNKRTRELISEALKSFPSVAPKTVNINADMCPSNV